MVRLALIMHAVVGTTLAGAAIVVVLTMGYDTLQPIVIAALVGFLVSIPASYYVAKAMWDGGGGTE